MEKELKKSLRIYGALLLLGVTGVPLGAAVGLIEALFCRLLLKVTAVRVEHLFGGHTGYQKDTGRVFKR